MQEAASPHSSPETLVYGYASISGKDEGIINEELREQAEVIATECERLGLELLQVISDREASRSNAPSRPGLEYALTRILRGEAAGLMVSELARLTRSPVQLGAVLEWFLQHKRRLVSVAADIDTDEPSGVLAARTLIGFSKRERERLTAQTRRGLEVARRSDDGPPRRPAVADDRDLAERIARMRERRMSLQAIADKLNADGIPTVRGGAKWRPSSLQSATGYRRRTPELATLLSRGEP
jgi:DNA invertase Pin-like site-specific DNA recombinase